MRSCRDSLKSPSETFVTRDIVHTRLHAYGDPQKALADFCAEFRVPGRVVEHAELVTSEAMPPVYRKLLVHNEHMTEKLRGYWGEDIHLNVLRHRDEGDVYQRHILLQLAGTGRVVEVGLARIDLSYTSDAVREKIVARRTPLGDVLISANVLRRIEPRWYFRFAGACPLLADFRDPELGAAYGRLGTIFCDDAPAIELLEIVTDRGERA